jgi:ribosomal protein L19
LKRDTRYFYGLVISRKINFLSTTLKIRNVFYNEIMEKTYPIFNIRNTLVSELPLNTLTHFLTIFLKNKKKKKTFYHIRDYPRAMS